MLYYHAAPEENSDEHQTVPEEPKPNDQTKENSDESEDEDGFRNKRPTLGKRHY